jgi:hypothetical protein
VAAQYSHIHCCTTADWDIGWGFASVRCHFLLILCDCYLFLRKILLSDQLLLKIYFTTSGSFYCIPNRTDPYTALLCSVSISISSNVCWHLCYSGSAARSYSQSADHAVHPLLHAAHLSPDHPRSQVNQDYLIKQY